MKILKRFLKTKQNEEEVCLPPDSPPEWNRFDLEGMCEQGSLTALLAFTTFLLVFGLSLWCYHRTLTAKGNVAKVEKDKYRKKHGFLLYFIREYLIHPWVPSTIEIFASIYFFLWFCLTITIGIARFYEKKWTQEVFFQQGPFNYLAHALFNCSTVDMTLVDYTEEINDSYNPNPPMQSPEELDPYFTKHLTFGILWLSIGFYHILNAQHGWSNNPEINRVVHRWFGRLVAMPSYLLHYYHAWKMVLRNPVQQDPIIKFQYIGTLVDNAILCVLGYRLILLARKEKDLKKKKELYGKHKNRMVFMYIESMFGSGTIRLTAWILWMIAKFCPRHIAMRLDRGVCQQSATCRGQFLGSAENCYIPTYINLSLGILLNLLLEYLFAKIPGNDLDKQELRIIKHRVKAVFRAVLGIIPFILWKGDEDSLLGNIIYYGGFIFSMISRMQTIWLYIGFNFDEKKAVDEKKVSVAVKGLSVSVAVKGQNALRTILGWDESW